MPINQPMNQIKLTNVALVRIRKGKKRFEVPCYRNKMSEWKSGAEKDINNVVQIMNVFINVNKGQAAPKADLEKAFERKIKNTKDMEDIVEIILREGQTQVGEEERGAELERTRNELLDIVASKLVDPKTKRVYTTGMIAKALDHLSSQSTNPQAEKAESAIVGTGEDKAKEALPKWTGVVPGSVKSAKLQANLAMKALIAHQPIPVTRMQMKLRVTCPTSVLKQAVKIAPNGLRSTDETGNELKAPGNVKEVIERFFAKTESQDVAGSEWEIVGLVDPGSFRGLNELVEGQTKGRGNVEVLDMAVDVDE